MPTPQVSCTRCRLRNHECVCGVAPLLDISTRLIVLIHSKEWRRTTNTGHFARLAVRGAEVCLHGSPKPYHALDEAAVDAKSTLVLFPGRGARPLTQSSIALLPKPLTLLVPDGNWNQTAHMMRRVPILSNARPVCLDADAMPNQCLRRNRAPGRISTFEAIVHALGILEGPETAERLLVFFRQILHSMTHNSRRSFRRVVSA